MQPTPTRGRWGLGGAVALAVLVLGLVQACGQSGRQTGPSGNSQVSLTLRRTNAQLPVGCTGNVFIDGGPNNVHLSAAIDPTTGKVSFPALQPGTYSITAALNCP